jgi:hypothetical protein
VQSSGNTPSISVFRSNNATNAAMISYEPTGTTSAGNPVWYSGMGGGSSDFQVTSWDGSTVSNHITVLTGGNVGIGKTNPSYKLDVQGDINSTGGSVRASGVALTSDVRFKKDIEPLDHALDRILNLRGVSYNWRKDEFPNKNFNDRHQVGVIAQEVEKQFPELVDQGVDGYKSVNYPALVAPVIEAIRELYNKYISQEAKLAQQQKQIDDLQKTVKGLRDLACAKDPKSDICQ